MAGSPGAVGGDAGIVGQVWYVEKIQSIDLLAYQYGEVG